jgi:N-acetylneuraminic acid mutarotase
VHSINNYIYKMKKSIIYFVISIITLFNLSGCHKKNTTVDPATILTGSWTSRSELGGVSRSSAVAFTINGKGYIGTGFDGRQRLNDFWAFTPDSSGEGTWEQKDSIPGVGREQAIGFSLGSRGYIGTGYDGTVLLKDFYEYDAGANQWTRKSDFVGSARYGAVGFSIDSSAGYIVAGYDGNGRNDMYKYIPSQGASPDSWISNMPSLGKKAVSATSFVIGPKAYVCTGINNTTFINEVWEYDPLINQWGTKAALSTDDNGDGVLDRDLRRSNAVGFTLNGMGYISTGIYGTLLINTWGFDPNLNTWSQVIDFPGGSRMDAAAFTIKNRAFILTGRNNNARYDDVWELTR